MKNRENLSQETYNNLLANYSILEQQYSDVVDTCLKLRKENAHLYYLISNCLFEQQDTCQ